MASANETTVVTHREYLYPLWLRLWHWSNAAGFLVLILSGISMHYAAPDAPWLPFATARMLHNVAGLAIAGLYLFYLVGNVLSGNWRHYVPKWRGLWKGVRTQGRFYLYGIFKNEPHPYVASSERKFNPMQQIAYLGVMYGLMPVLIVTGLFLLFPAKAPEKILGAGGVWPMAVLHSVVAYFATAFLVSHVYLATTGNPITEHFKNMITGWHESRSEPTTTKETSP